MGCLYVLALHAPAISNSPQAPFHLEPIQLLRFDLLPKMSKLKFTSPELQHTNPNTAAMFWYIQSSQLGTDSHVPRVSPSP